MFSIINETILNIHQLHQEHGFVDKLSQGFAFQYDPIMNTNTMSREHTNKQTKTIIWFKRHTLIRPGIPTTVSTPLLSLYS